MYGLMSVTDIIAELKKNNQAEDCQCGKEEDQEIEEKPLSSATEAMVHKHELLYFFVEQSSVEDYILA